MKFNDETNKQGIIQDITHWTGADTSTFPMDERTRMVNEWYRLTVARIENYSSQSWRFDDRNFSTIPITETDLKDGYEQYQLPHEARRVLQVDVKDSDGEWHKLEHIDMFDMDGIAYSEFFDEKGFPYYYDLMGDSIYLKPAPDSSQVTTSSGLRMYVTRGISEFSASDTSTEPGFQRSLHRILSLGPSYDYLVANGAPNEQTAKLGSRLKTYQDVLAELYSSRPVEGKTRIRPQRKSMI